MPTLHVKSMYFNNICHFSNFGWSLTYVNNIQYTIAFETQFELALNDQVE